MDHMQATCFLKRAAVSDLKIKVWKSYEKFQDRKIDYKKI